MSKNNLSAVLYGIDDIRLEHRDIQPLKEHDVLLEMQCVGICGSDVHYWKQGRIAHFVVKEPMIMGHESSGIVRKVGTEVKHLKPGDRVAIEPGISCLRCEFCKKGRYNLCPDLTFCATPPVHGNMSRYYVHSADFCHKLPDHVSMEAGALMEPLAVGVHGCRRGEVTVGKKVLILGSGPIGLVTLLVAQHMGAYKVAITDILESKLEIAKQHGCKYTLLVKREMTDEEFVENVEKLLDGPPDVTIDCLGFESTVKQGILVTKPGGILVVVGLGGDNVRAPIPAALIKEVDIRGIFRYANDYERALAIVAEGNANIERLITHKYKMEDVVEAFKTAHSGNAIKVMIYCGEEK